MRSVTTKNLLFLHDANALKPVFNR